MRGGKMKVDVAQQRAIDFYNKLKMNNKKNAKMMNGNVQGFKTLKAQ